MTTFLRRITKIFVTIVTVVVLLLLTVLLLSQTGFVRNFVLNEIKKEVASATNATLTSDDLQGNLFRGFVLKNVHLRLHTGSASDSIELLSAEELIARYSLFRYIRHSEFGITSIRLQKPVIHFVKAVGDTLWNFQRFLKPTPPNTPASPFTSIIDLQSLKIANGTFIARDFNQPADSITSPKKNGVRAIDWKNINATGLGLDASLLVRGGNSQSVRINDLQLRERASNISIEHLELSAYHDSLQTRITLGHLITNGSDIRFAASLAPFSMLTKGGTFAEMKNAGATIQLNAPVVSTSELAAFIPSLTTLGGSPGLDIQASGTVGNLHLEHLRLNLRGQGTLNISGYLRNMQQPSEFTMDLDARADQLNDASLKHYLPGIYTANLQSTGTIAIRSMHFSGKPLDFTDNFDITTSHGNFVGSAELNFLGKRRQYKLDLKTSHVDIASFLGRPSLRSDLNLALKLNGNGTNWRTLSSSVIVSTTGKSNLGTYSIESLDVTALVSAGTITTDHLLAALSDGPTIAIQHGSYSFSRTPNAYAVKGLIENLPLRRYVKAFDASPARLAVDLDMSGEGLDLEQITGTAGVRLSKLSLEGERFNDVLATISMSHASGDSGRSLTLRSDLADLDLHGEFGLTDLVGAIPGRFALLDSAIKSKYFPDIVWPEFVGGHPTSLLTCDTIQMMFALKLKDLRPLSALMPSMMLLANGEVSGAVNGCIDNQINVYAKGNLKSFLLRTRQIPASGGVRADVPAVRSDSTGSSPDTSIAAQSNDTTYPSYPRIQLTPMKFDLAMEHLGLEPREALKTLHASLSIDADSDVRFGNLLLFRPHATVSYADRQAQYDLAATFDQVYALHAAGSAAFGGRMLRNSNSDASLLQQSDREEFISKLDTLSLTIRKGYQWLNERPTQLSFRSDGRFILDTLRMIHREPGDVRGAFTERLQAAVDLLGDSIRSAWLSVPSFRMNELPEFFTMPGASERLGDLDGKVQQLDLVVSGSLQHPAMDARLRIDRLRYSNLVFDSCIASLGFKNETLKGNILMHVDSVQFALSNFGDQRAMSGITSHNKLLITIDSIPALFALAHGADYSTDSAAVLKRTLSARVETNHFPIDLAATFLPAVDQLSGFGDIALSLKGTQEHIQFGGAATLRDGAFRVQATNLYYTFDGKLSFAEQILHLDSLVLTNSPDDDPAGQALVTGSLKFRGFNLDSFDIAARTRRLTVLTPASRSTLHMLYGPLVISTFNEPLQFVGPASSPLLRGKVAIVQSFLTIPQQQQSSAQSSSDGIIYKAYSIGKENVFDSTRMSDSGAKTVISRALVEDSVGISDRLFPARAQNIFASDTGTAEQDSITVAQATGVGMPKNSESSFMDRMRYDLNLDIPSDAWIIIPMYGLVGEQLRADMRTDGPFRVLRGFDHVYHITGTLSLTENSSYSFYKTFSPASGTITFYDDPTNPVIDITAEYVGSHGDKGGEAKIRLLVSGTLSAPVLTMEIYRRDNTASDFVKDIRSQSDIQEDALYFLVTGSFKNELGTGEAVNAIGKMSGALPAQLATSMLNNVLGETVFKNLIRSVSFDYAGNASRLKLTAGYRDLVFHYGQTGVGSSALDADYSVEVPFSFFMNFSGSKYFVLDFDYHPLQNQSLETLQQPNYSAKFLWRYPF